ncbi:MAG TPA: DUF4328 domain-containing protein [Pyrinomonadaceae bacterium]|nr:DUF4328 domain-containing protein [Pyrinomonadaceae bacterium]
MMTEQPSTQPADGLVASEPFVSAHGRAMVVLALFGAYIVIMLCSIGLSLMRLTMAPVVLGGGGPDEQFTLDELLQFFVGLGNVLVYVALVVAFLVWLHRASKNVPALGNQKSKVEFTPGWAVGWFFIPLANLVMPYRAVREVWEKSDPAVRTEADRLFTPPSSGGLLLAWWICWIASNVASNIAVRLQADARTADAVRALSGVMIFSDLLDILAAVLAFLVVRGLDRRQRERSRNVTYLPHRPPPPPVFTTQQPPPFAPPGA